MNSARDEQRDRTIAALVEEQYQAALDAGTVIHNPAAFRASKHGDTVRQAREHPGWLRQQSDRIFGAQKRPGKLATCPHCDLTFDPRTLDYHPAPWEPFVDTTPRWTNGRLIVAVPPQHERFYADRGYTPMPDWTPAPPPPAPDSPARGADGLLYCRASCANHEPFVSLDQHIADHPEATDAGTFLRGFLERTNQRQRLTADDLPTPAFADDIPGMDDEIPLWSPAA